MFSASQTTKLVDQFHARLSQGWTPTKEQLLRLLQPFPNSDDQVFAQHLGEEAAVISSQSQINEPVPSWDPRDLLHANSLTIELLNRTLNEQSLALPFLHWLQRVLFGHISPSLKVLFAGINTLRCSLTKLKDLPLEKPLQLNPFTQYVLRGLDAGSIEAIIERVLKPIHDATNLDDAMGTLKRLLLLEERYATCNSLVEWCATLYIQPERLDIDFTALSLNREVLNLLQSMPLREMTEGGGSIEQELHIQWEKLYELVKHDIGNLSVHQVANYSSLAEQLYHTKNYHSLSAVLSAMTDSGIHILHPELKAFHVGSDTPFGWNEPRTLLWMESVRAYINQSARPEWRHNQIMTFMSKILLYGKRTASKPRILLTARSQTQLNPRTLPTGVCSPPAPPPRLDSSGMQLRLFPTPPSSSRPSATMHRDQTSPRGKPLSCSLPNPQTDMNPLVSAYKDPSGESGHRAAYSSAENPLEKVEVDVRSAFSTESSAPRSCFGSSMSWTWLWKNVLHRRDET